MLTDQAAFQDFIDRGDGPKIDRTTDEGVPMFAKEDLVRFAILTFGAGDEAARKEMLEACFAVDSCYELVWRSGTAEIVLVDFED
jgi:hypothetical protein